MTKFNLISYLECDPKTPVWIGSFDDFEAARNDMYCAVHEWVDEVLQGRPSLDHMIAIDVARAIVKTPDEKGCKWFITDELWQEVDVTLDMIKRDVVLPPEEEIEAEIRHFFTFNVYSDSVNFLSHFVDIFDRLFEKYNPFLMTGQAAATMWTYSDSLVFDVAAKVLEKTPLGRKILSCEE